MSDLQSISMQIAQQMKWWTSVQLDVRDRIQHTRESEAILSRFATLVTQTDYHYEETAAGERRLSTSSTYKDGRVQRSEDYFDGRKAAAAEFSKEDPVKQSRVSKGGSFGREQSFGHTNRPTPLKWYYVGKIPLYEAVAKARSLGEEEIASTPCVKYMFDDVVLGQTPQSLLYYLRKEDSLPIRIESYKGPDPAATPKQWIWEADKVDVVQGHPVVVRSHLIRYNADSSVVRNTLYSEVKHVAFNKKIGMETFRPIITPEAEIRDGVTGRIQRPARKEQEGQYAAVDLPETTMGAAVPPPASTQVFTGVSYGMGTLLVLVGVILTLRR